MHFLRGPRKHLNLTYQGEIKVLFPRPPTREEEGLRGHLALRLRAAALYNPALPDFYIALLTYSIWLLVTSNYFV